jgi:hypothetical protein
MNAKHEPSAEKKALVDTLLAIDSRMPTSSAEGREIAKQVLRRDRRRVRIITWMTMGFFLLTIIGICGCVYWYSIKVLPGMNRFQLDIHDLDQQLIKREDQLAKQEPQPSKPDLLAMTARISAAASYQLFMIQHANLGGTMVLFVVMLAAAFCTVLLIMATRGATLRQIQASLLALSEQFDALQQSLHSRPSGRDQAKKESSG